MKIRGQIARATSQEELDSIIIPKQCIASKNEETDSTQNSEKQEELPKIKDSSSDSNSNSKKSSSEGDYDKSDSKTKNEDPNCFEDPTPALAALGEVTVNRCSGDAIPSSDDESVEIINPITAYEQANFEKGYQDGFTLVFDSSESVLVDAVRKLISADNLSSAYRMGVLYGVEAGLAVYEIEANLQRDTMDALGIQALNITKLKK